MKNIKFYALGLTVIMLLITSSCVDDLNTEPKVQLTPEQVKSKVIEGLLSKVYSTYALSGSDGPGSTDTPGDDAGESPFLRGIINLQDFTSDGLKNRWGDNGLDQLTTTSGWNPDNKFFRYVYNRVYYTVPQANNLIDVINKEPDFPNKQQYISEMRFLRALAYFYLIDCFGKGPLLTEDDLGSTVLKNESTRAEIFEFVESELIDICDENLTSNTDKLLPFTTTYGRANRTAARMLLAKLYLNAQVYIGAGKFDLAYKYSKLVIDEGGYKLADSFRSLFSRDNDVSDAKSEIIYALIADPLTSQSYGNTTYLICGSLSSQTMVTTDYGNPGGDSNAWGGHRATKGWYGLFANSAEGLATSSDDRARLFFSNYTATDPTKRHNYEMTDYKKWIDGFPSIKFVNTNFVGDPGSPVLFAGTDFPMYRLADAYLMLAESILRGGGGATGDALFYVNAVRARSNASLINASDLTLDFILDERARELNFEGHRRTDLIRFGKFAGSSYIWPWKGGVKDGASISEDYKLFPIPLKAIQANPNLTQNPGY